MLQPKSQTHNTKPETLEPKPIFLIRSGGGNGECVPAIGLMCRLGVRVQSLCFRVYGLEFKAWDFASLAFCIRGWWTVCWAAVEEPTLNHHIMGI